MQSPPSLPPPVPICGGALSFVHLGTAWGNGSPRDAEARGRALDALGRLEVRQAVWMQPDFTAVLVEFDDAEPIAPGLSRARRPCDGVVVSAPSAAVLLSNGDCAVGVLSNGHEAAVLHLGLACLYRPDGEPTVLERAVERLSGEGGRREALRFWVGGAIGPCCHGYAHTTEAERERAAALRARWGEDVLGGVVRQGPRRGAVAYDHRLMAARHAEELGVQRVTIQSGCTACAGLADPDLPGFGTFFSHTRDHQGRRERNLAIIALRAPRSELGL